MANVSKIKLPNNASYDVTDASALHSSDKGAINGVAPLNASGLIDSAYLPSYVDDVIEGYYYNNKFWKESTHTTEIVGETGKIYINLETNPATTYRYSGSAFVQIGSGGSVVTITRNLTSGVKSATINIDGTSYDLYSTDDTTYESKAAVSGGTAVSLVTTGEKATWNAKSSFSGSYNDLTDKPTIPDVSGKIDTAGTGLSKSGTTLNHSNSISAQTTQAVYPIKIDAQGHISGYGDAVTSMPASDVSSWAKQSSKPSYTASEVGAVPTTRKVNGKALSSDISLTASDVSALPSSTVIPTITDTYSGTSSNGMSGKAVKSAIDALDGTVTGSAGAGKTLTAFSQTDGKVSATFGDISITKSQISDFPSFATVATSGSYNDLSNKPTIPTVNNATLTIQKNGSTVNTFTANASSNVTANIIASRTIKVAASSVSSLPLTISNSAITTNMECINAVLSNPSAQTSDWTCNTDTAGSVVVSGTISGTTNITLYLTEV